MFCFFKLLGFLNALVLEQSIRNANLIHVIALLRPNRFVRIANLEFFYVFVGNVNLSNCKDFFLQPILMKIFPYSLMIVHTGVIFTNEIILRDKQLIFGAHFI